MHITTKTINAHEEKNQRESWGKELGIGIVQRAILDQLKIQYIV